MLNEQEKQILRMYHEFYRSSAEKMKEVADMNDEQARTLISNFKSLRLTQLNAAKLRTEADIAKLQ